MIQPGGAVIATYKKVPVFENGVIVIHGYGRHYSDGGYHYGQKWQCVKSIKRSYNDAENHHMPSIWERTKDF